MTDNERNTLQETITHFLEDMKKEQGDSFSLEKVNLSEMARRTGISRKRLRLIQKNGFKVLPNGNKNKQKEHTVLSGYTGIIEEYLKRGVRNSHTITDILQDNGYTGSRSQVKRYIASHLYLIPAKREIVSPQGNRGRRYKTEPGECFQMDWGFVNVDTGVTTYRAACFAMICHHCGSSYVEFFPNAKQENLFIGMIHAFEHLGIPKYVLTDNMKSVVNGRDADGHPLWNHEYETFMDTIGFQTKLCKPRHPFTKGAVERLVRFVKESFMTGRIFGNVTDLNIEALRWCEKQNNDYHKVSDCVPAREHARRCMTSAREFSLTNDARRYLCPERRISFDGFVNYEGRRFGVPHSYKTRVCRVMRKDYELFILSDDMQEILAKHNVTWSRRDSFCKDQFVDQPEEFPTMPVKVSMKEQPSDSDYAFHKFNFDKEVDKNV
jgi:transposase